MQSMPEFDQGTFFTRLLIHPQEREAENAVQKSTLISALAKDTADLKVQLTSAAELRLNNYLATEVTAPRLYRQYKRALASLADLHSGNMSWNQVYPLFVVQDYQIRADVYGSDKKGYIICVTSEALKELSDAELRALLGQALGHIRAGHVQFIELLRLLRAGTEQIPIFGALGSSKLWSFFSHWQFYSDYTADRTGAICAGSIEAVLTLLCKQIGAVLPSQTPYTVMEQKTSGLPSTSVYLVWAAQNTPVFNAIGRMRELTRWSMEKEFQSQFPFMYYAARADRQEAARDEADRELMELHRKAETGDANAAATLGECYLRELKGLPGKRELGLSLIKYAALHGNGSAMYLLYCCADINMEGANYSHSLTQQLLRASAVRCSEVKQQPPKPRLEGLNHVVQQLWSEDARFSVCDTAPGEPLETDVVDNIRKTFFLEVDEPVIAYETYRRDGIYCGTVVSSYGIYGRMPGKEMPFAVDWSTFRKNDLSMGRQGGKTFLYSGKRRICYLPGELEGSIGELLVELKTLFDG